MQVGTSSDQGLYSLDTDSGTATKLGPGVYYQTLTYRTGLAGRGPNESLIGTDTLALYEFTSMASSPQSVSSGCGAYGLAYDVLTDELYRVLGSSLVRSSVGTCDIYELISSSLELDGLAIDSANGKLYGIGEESGSVYAMDVKAGAPYTWTPVFDTGVGGWEDAGLAFDQENEVLYAVGHPTDGPGLYRIDLSVPSMERVGDTGLGRAYGGLAWRYESD